MTGELVIAGSAVAFIVYYASALNTQGENK